MALEGSLACRAPGGRPGQWPRRDLRRDPSHATGVAMPRVFLGVSWCPPGGLLSIATTCGALAGGFGKHFNWNTNNIKESMNPFWKDYSALLQSR